VREWRREIEVDGIRCSGPDRGLRVLGAHRVRPLVEQRRISTASLVIGFTSYLSSDRICGDADTVRRREVALRRHGGLQHVLARELRPGRADGGLHFLFLLRGREDGGHPQGLDPQLA
jgi:hypothetical protein